MRNSKLVNFKSNEERNSTEEKMLKLIMSASPHRSHANYELFRPLVTHIREKGRMDIAGELPNGDPVVFTIDHPLKSFVIGCRFESYRITIQYGGMVFYSIFFDIDERSKVIIPTGIYLVDEEGAGYIQIFNEKNAETVEETLYQVTDDLYKVLQGLRYGEEAEMLTDKAMKEFGYSLLD